MLSLHSKKNKFDVLFFRMARTIERGLSVDECNKSLIHGEIDVDSVFLLGLNLFAFKPDSINNFFIHNKKYSFTKNLKATKRLERELRKRNCNYDFIKYGWLEGCLFNLGTNPIYVLFLVEKVDEPPFNIYVDFIEKVIKRSFNSLPLNSRTRKEYVDGPCPSNRPVRLFEEDYPPFALAVSVYTSQFLRDHEFAREVFFYNCRHGLKAKFDTALSYLHTIASLRKEFILFIQLHFGFTMNSPKDAIFLLKLNRLKTEFLNFNWSMRKMYFFKQFGHFCDVNEVAGFPSIDYVHCYETIQHRISRSRFGKSIFCYALTNGFPDESPAISRHRSGTVETIDRILALKRGHSECLDLRIEIVEHFSDVSLLIPDNFADNFSATHGPRDSLSVFPQFLQRLVNKKCFFILRNWTGYVTSQIGKDISLLTKVKECKTPCSPPTKDHVTRVYWAENRVIAFLDGNKNRFDYEEITKQRVLTSTLTATILDPPDNYSIPPEIFSKHTNWRYFSTKCPEYFECLYNACSTDIESTLVKRSILESIHYLFQTIAIFNNCMSQEGAQQRNRINPQTYFKTQRKVPHNLFYSRNRILDVLTKSQTMPMKIIFMHCGCFSSPRFLELLSDFIFEKVSYFPAKFVDSSHSWGVWGKILTDDKTKYLGGILALSGKDKRKLYLKQYANFRNAFENLNDDQEPPAKRRKH